MTRLRPILLLLALFLASPAARAADAWPAAGSRGYGLTVLSGTRVETFACVYIGVLEKTFPGQDLHLIRLEGAYFETTGVIAGMSGSPIYFDGRLLGALAYGWGFTREPIAGVTPIESMRSAAEIPNPSAGRAALPPGLVPIATPVWASGLAVDPARLGEILGTEVMLLPAGNGAAPRGAAAGRFENGGAIGVPLMTGDLELSAIGTVTLVEGDRVFAFGHPFLARGRVEYPIATAEILTILPSLARSSKIGRTGPIAGRLTRDLQPAIVGEMGAAPAMIPLTVEAATPTGTRRFDFRIAKDDILTAPLLGMANDAALSAIAGDLGRGEAEIEVEVAAEGRTYRFADRGLFRFSPAEAAIIPPLSALWENPYRRVFPESVSVRIRIRESNEYHRILEAVLPARPVHPGEEVPVRVVLESNEGVRSTREVAIRIPRNFPAGRHRLLVGPGRGWRIPGLAPPESLETLLARFDRYERKDELVVALERPGRGAFARGEALPSLPASVRGIQGGALPAEIRWVFPQDKILTNSIYTTIRIEEASLEEEREE